MRLANKVAVVTGASRGIGRAIALRLAEDGAAVVVNYKNSGDAAQAVVQEIESQGGRAVALQADVANLSDVRRLFEEVERTFAHIDILVNNAGWADFKPLENITEEHFDTLFNLNVRGLLFTTQEAVKRMNDQGRVINISSGITRANAAGGSVYSGSKAAVEAFTRCWAAELGPRGITVNTVSPGMTQTDLMTEVIPAESLDAMIAQTPLGRLGQPADIADVVAFLCSDEARWLTAQNLLVNGGVG
ncbi:MAG: SDR family oxidoreductase [Abitibacteriaceae bacterium]|nr:SDR family oxidoreductase [Abditibacteriaceae bacterium]